MKHTQSNSIPDFDRDEKSMPILQAAFSAWNNCHNLRKARTRNKNFTYGKQWNDPVKTRDGRTITESRMLEETGREPMTNNLIRQLVKSVVGRFRNSIKEEPPSKIDSIKNANLLDELDSRGLEEFLISGCCVQKVGFKRRLNKCEIGVENININHFFINSIQDTRGWDCEIIGELHDMSISEMIMRLSGGNRERAAWLRKIYSEEALYAHDGSNSSISLGNGSGEFTKAAGGKCRVIEVWTLESEESILCHDHKSGECYRACCSDLSLIEATNQERESEGTQPIDTVWDITQVWRCSWLSPQGDLLAHYDSPFPHKSHPYVFKLYPLTDGEIHGFVEDVIDQQKYINRLITLVDHVMNVSAKGVLMFPADSLPENHTWEDIKKIWSSPYGVLPYEPGRGGVPHQISANATNIGAYELLSLEMKLFEEISGVTGALQGKTPGATTGALLYEHQAQNAAIALTDIFDTFTTFRHQRDRMIEDIISASSVD